MKYSIKMSLRKYLNDKFIISNPSIVEEIFTHNKQVGRINNPIRRFIYVANVFWKYSVVHSTLPKQRLKSYQKLVYPESNSQELPADKGYTYFPNELAFEKYLISLTKLLEITKNVDAIRIDEIFNDNNIDLNNYKMLFSSKAQNLGNPYRPYFKANIILDLYSLIVNEQFHSGMKYSLLYEYGFEAGGLLTYGFCQYLDRLAKENNIDKFIFIARDGDIIKKIYDKYFGKVETDYLIFSRFASLELIFKDYPLEYIENNILPRVDRKNKNTVRDVLVECGLLELEKYLLEYQLNSTDIFSFSEYQKLKILVLDKKEEVIEIFSVSYSAAREYFLPVVGGYKNICIVDLGWRGTSIIYLKHLLSKFDFKGNVIGALIGASNNRLTQTYIRNGMINVFAFENDMSFDELNINGQPLSYEQILCFEALFSSEECSLLRYVYDEYKNVSMIYSNNNPNVQLTKQIQSGVFDFVEEYDWYAKKFNLRVTATDAYTPLKYILYNKKLLDLIIKSYIEKEKAINGFEV